MKSLNMLLIFILFSFLDGKTSDQGILFLIEREGFDISQYTDYNTIIDLSELGFLNDKGIYLGMPIESIDALPLSEGQNILRYLLEKIYEKLVDKYDLLYHFNQNQYDALISFAYNMGNIDELTNYGTKTIEQISSSFMDFKNDIEGNNVYETRRQKEKELFDTPVNRIVKSTLKIAHCELITSSYIFEAILTSEDYTRNTQNNYDFIAPQDIGIIFYDTQNGNTMKTECCSFEKGALQCQPYYPIQKGEYIVKLDNNGYFDAGLMVLPFDLTNDMKTKTNQNEKDKIFKITETKFQLPIFKEYIYTNGLYGNFFFHIGTISLYNKKEIIKDKYPLEIELIFCYLNYTCAKENNYQIECKIIPKDANGIYLFNGGEYLLKCMGTINTDVYNRENFGNHIEIRYNIGKSNLQEIQNGILNSFNFKKESPRDILEITSFTYEYNPNEGNIFKFYGKSLKNKEIRNIGSNTNLYNFNIIFTGGYYVGNIPSKCFLYNDNLNDFVIQCYLKGIIDDDNILFSAVMDNIFINEQNNEYDIILPFEFALNVEIKKWDKADYNEDEYCDYTRNIPEINSEICKAFHVSIYNEDSSICDFSEEENRCIERPMQCTEIKTRATLKICSDFNNDPDFSKVCVKEGDSCIETNSCSKVKFYSGNVCEKLKASNSDDICIKAGEECREINAEKYKNRNNRDENEITTNNNPENPENKKEDIGKKLSLSFALLSLFLIL